MRTEHRAGIIQRLAALGPAAAGPADTAALRLRSATVGEAPIRSGWKGKIAPESFNASQHLALLRLVLRTQPRSAHAYRHFAFGRERAYVSVDPAHLFGISTIKPFASI